MDYSAINQYFILYILLGNVDVSKEKKNEIKEKY